MPDLTDIDAVEIAPFLYQGSAPPAGPYIAALGFNAVVLCAMEYQIEAKLFEGVSILHAPNDDNSKRPPTKTELSIAVNAARQVAKRIRDGQHVLVTCMAGLNRSGLVSALTLHILYGWNGSDCARHVQTKRGNALCNPQFVKVLSTLRAKPAQSLAREARR